MKTKKMTKEEIVKFLNEWKDACLSGNLAKLKTFFLRPADGVLTECGSWESLENLCEMSKKISNPKIKWCEDFCINDICENPARVRLWAFATCSGEFEKKEVLCAKTYYMIIERKEDGGLAFVILARPCVHFISDCPPELKKAFGR